MKTPRNIEDIEAFISSRVQESLHLDYKMSKAINDSKRNEIAKDVSAFSNSDGGLLIYGVQEEEHLPVKIDEGVNHKKYTREWLEQVLVSNISPIIDNLEIIQIPINDSNSLFIINVPKSNRGPHQERGTKKYYKRYNFKSSPMEDYEITDIRNRAFTIPPLINVDISLEYGSTVYIDIQNIGDVAALDVKIKLPDDFSWKRYKECPPIFERPIKYYPSGKKLSYMYGIYSTLISDDSIDKEFTITVEYINSRNNEVYTDSFYFNLLDYMYTRLEKSDIHELGKILKDSVEKLTDKIEKLNQYSNELSRIVDPSGLALSVTTINNLQAILKEGKSLKKLDPYESDSRIFQEVLGVSSELAQILSRNFEHKWYDDTPPKELQDIEGLDELLIREIEKKFIIE